MKTLGRILLILAVVAGIAGFTYALAEVNGWTSLGRRTLEEPLTLPEGSPSFLAREERGLGHGRGRYDQAAGGINQAEGQENFRHDGSEEGRADSLEWMRTLLGVAVVTAVVASLDRVLRRKGAQALVRSEQRN